jgi:polyferredoxin
MIALILLSSVLIYSLSQRTAIALDIIRDRNQLYRETSGLIENIYTLKLINMDNDAHEFNIKAEGIDNLILLVDKEIISVEGGTVFDLPVRVLAEEENLQGRSSVIYFVLSATDKNDLTIKQEAKFLGPIP